MIKCYLCLCRISCVRFLGDNFGAHIEAKSLAGQLITLEQSAHLDIPHTLCKKCEYLYIIICVKC